METTWDNVGFYDTQTTKLNTFQVIVDAIVDSTCMIVPLCIIYFVYDIQLTIEDTIAFFSRRRIGCGDRDALTE